MSKLPFRNRDSVLLALACLLAACSDKVPAGQVVAVVDGEEVTRREVAAEPQAANLPDGDDAQQAMGAMLSGVIDRKLAAAEARRLKLDRTPQYVAQAKRVEEVMLSRTLFDRWVAETPQPDKRAIADYIARNPQRFGARKLFLVDRIATKADKSDDDALTPLQTNDAVAAYLDSRGRTYRRDRAVVDSAGLAPALYRQLVKLAPGYPLAVVQDGGLVALAVIEVRDAPLSAQDAATQAVKAIKAVAVQRKLADLRRSAKIAYQSGYRPAAATGVSGDAHTEGQ